MKLWKSRLLKDYGRLNLKNILQGGPEKNLVVLNYRHDSFFLYKISDRNPGPIKLQVKNKNRILLFDVIDNLDFIKIKDEVFAENYLLNFNEHYFNNYISTKAGILCRLDYEDTMFMYMWSADKERVLMFFNALRNEGIISKC